MTNPHADQIASNDTTDQLAVLWSAALAVLDAARVEATMGDWSDGKPMTVRAESRRRLAESVELLDGLLGGERFDDIFRLAAPAEEAAA